MKVLDFLRIKKAVFLNIKIKIELIQIHNKLKSLYPVALSQVMIEKI